MSGTSSPADARSPVLVRLAVVGFISTLGFSGFEATFSLFGERRFGLTEGSAALVFLVVGLTLVVVQGGLIGPLASRAAPAKLARIGLVLVGLGLVLLALSEQWTLLIPSMVLLAVGQGIASPTVTNLVTESAPPDRRGEALGYQQSAGAFARIVGPLIAGAMFDHVGVGAPYFLGGALFLLALAVLPTSVGQRVEATR